MGYYDFPHTRNYDTDLGYLIKQYLLLRDEVELLISTQTITYADPLQWNITTQYKVNTIVINGYNAYLSKQAVPSGILITNTDYWLTVGDFIKEFDDLRNNIANANAGVSPTATKDLNIGDLVWWNDTLYQCISDMSIGTAFIVDSNIKHITIEDYVDSINTKLTTDLQTEINNRKEAIVETLNNNKEYTDKSINHISVKNYGAIGDGVNDDTTAIQSALDALIDKPGYCLDFGSGTYLITKPLTIGRIYDVNINNGYIVASDTFSGDYMFKFPGDFDVALPGSPYKVINNININNLTIDCNFKCAGIELIGFLKLKIDKITIANPINYGIRCTRQDAHELVLTNCFIVNKQVETKETNCVNIELNTNDNIISNLVIIGGKCGIYFAGASHCNIIDNVHIYAINTLLDNTNHIGIYLEISSTNNIFSNIYLDGCVIYSKAQWGLNFSNILWLAPTESPLIFSSDGTGIIGEISIVNSKVYAYDKLTTTFDLIKFDNITSRIRKDNTIDILIQIPGSYISNNSNRLAIIKNNNNSNRYNTADGSDHYEFNQNGYLFVNSSDYTYNLTNINNEIVINSFNESGYRRYGKSITLEKNTNYAFYDLNTDNSSNMVIIGKDDLNEGQGTILAYGIDGINTFNSGTYNYIFVTGYSTGIKPMVYKLS